MSKTATASQGAVSVTRPSVGLVDPSQRIPVGEKLGYSLGDAAANFVFQSLIVFQTIFYTDTFGITAGETALLLLIARVADAFFDPLFGILSDRTHTRWGKFRPWIIATAIPYGVMAVIAFSTPNGLSHAGKLAYAYATYLGLMLVYSANNLPYSALSGVLTGDLNERTSLSSYRFFLAISASFVIQAITPNILTHFSGGSTHWTPHAFQSVMLMFGSLSVIFFVITFFSTKERIVSSEQSHGSIGSDLAGLLKNGPWLALFGLTLLVFITLAMRGGCMAYYFQYYMTDHHLFGRDLDQHPVFGLFNALGAFNGVSQGACLIGILFAKPLAVRFGKRDVFIAGLTLTAILTAIFTIFGRDQIGWAFATEGVRSLAYGFTIPLLWAMMADVADYSEWTTGRRATGIVFSAIVFGLKAGLGFGGAIQGKLFELYGYAQPVHGNVQPQTAHALEGIRLTSSLYASLPFFAGVICLFFYKINKRAEIQITSELAARRRATGTLPPAVIATEGIVLPEAP